MYTRTSSLILRQECFHSCVFPPVFYSKPAHTRTVCPALVAKLFLLKREIKACTAKDGRFFELTTDTSAKASSVGLFTWWQAIQQDRFFLLEFVEDHWKNTDDSNTATL
jgi:hypothetical protein